MKSYYDAHEEAYQHIKRNGHLGWGNARTLSELGDPATMNFLTETTKEYLTPPEGKTALDLGCGTGTTAFALARLGFDVTGIDISETAIKMAHKLAMSQNLQIDFFVADVLSLDDLNTEFDLIYDSHCLHCIVFEDDRKLLFSGAQKILATSGYFIVDTMVAPPPEAKFDFTGGLTNLRMDENGILWHRTTPSKARGVIQINGDYWCAQRRLYSSEVVIDEIQSAGFTIISKTLDHQPGNHSMLRLVLKK